MLVNLLLLLLGIGLHPFQHLYANAVSLQLGGTLGDMAPDARRYAQSYQSEIFGNKRLVGVEMKGIYRWFFNETVDIRRAWVFALATNQASVEQSYPNGALKMERSLVYSEVGFRYQVKNIWPDIHLAWELLLMSNLGGTVKVSSAMGSEEYPEKTGWLRSTLSGAASIEYQLTPQYSSYFTLQAMPYNCCFGAFLGISYQLVAAKKSPPAKTSSKQATH